MRKWDMEDFLLGCVAWSCALLLGAGLIGLSIGGYYSYLDAQESKKNCGYYGGCKERAININVKKDAYVD